jgi:hypothetical protein
LTSSRTLSLHYTPCRESTYSRNESIAPCFSALFTQHSTLSSPAKKPHFSAEPATPSASFSTISWRRLLIGSSDSRRWTNSCAENCWNEDAWTGMEIGQRPISFWRTTKPWPRGMTTSQTRSHLTRGSTSRRESGKLTDAKYVKHSPDLAFRSDLIRPSTRHSHSTYRWSFHTFSQTIIISLFLFFKIPDLVPLFDYFGLNLVTSSFLCHLSRGQFSADPFSFSNADLFVWLSSPLYLKCIRSILTSSPSSRTRTDLPNFVLIFASFLVSFSLILAACLLLSRTRTLLPQILALFPSRQKFYLFSLTSTCYIYFVSCQILSVAIRCWQFMDLVGIVSLKFVYLLYLYTLLATLIIVKQFFFAVTLMWDHLRFGTRTCVPPDRLQSLFVSTEASEKESRNTSKSVSPPRRRGNGSWATNKLHFLGEIEDFVPGEDIILIPEDYDDYDLHSAQVYTAYKPVDRRVRPVSGTFPQDALVRRTFPHNPLEGCTHTFKEPSRFSPTAHISEERLKMININGEGFLWAEEEKLFIQVMLLNEKASSL